SAAPAHSIAADGLAREILKWPPPAPNPDDRNIVEFGFARSVGVPRALMVPELRRVAAASGFARPPLSDEDGIDWPAVDTARVSYNASEDFFDDRPSTSPPAEQARQQALAHYFRSTD